MLRAAEEVEERIEAFASAGASDWSKGERPVQRDNGIVRVMVRMRVRARARARVKVRARITARGKAWGQRARW